MIQQIFKQIWAQRRSNLWIFLELMLVAVFLWFIIDRVVVTTYIYTKPRGFDHSHVYRLKLNILEPGVSGYISPESTGTTETEDLLKLMEQIQIADGVESLSLSYFSSFYSFGNSSNLLMLDTVTNEDNVSGFHVRKVSPGFFDVFRIRNEDGSRIDPALLTTSSVVLSKDLKDKLFGNQNAIGRLVKQEVDGGTLVVAAVTTSIRDTEYQNEDLCYFECLIGPRLNEIMGWAGVSSSELMVRVSPQFDKDFINTFVPKLGDRAQVNNIYISSIIPISDMRTRRLDSHWKEEKTGLSLTAFILINVFFGIIATFWMRTGYRKGEIGLRMALGASRRSVFKYLFLEGICLLALTLLPVIFISLNIIFGGFVETDRLGYTFWRFCVSMLLTYAILYAMIALGVWYPARRSAKTEPATALHYE